MKKFKLRPELNDWKYYAHLVGISLVVLLILQLWKGGNMLSIFNVFIGAFLIGLADVINHTLWRLD